MRYEKPIFPRKAPSEHVKAFFVKRYGEEGYEELLRYNSETAALKSFFLDNPALAKALRKQKEGRT